MLKNIPCVATNRHKEGKGGKTAHIEFAWQCHLLFEGRGNERLGKGLQGGYNFEHVKVDLT